MNIALITDNIIRISQIVSDYYDSRGNKVYHFLLTQRRKLDYPVNDKVVYLKKSLHSSSNFISFVQNTWDVSTELRELKNKYNIDIAISFQELFNIINVLSKGREKCIVSVRTTLSYRPELRGYEYNKNIIKTMYNMSDGVVTAGEFVKDDLIHNYHVNKSKVYAIPNPAIIYPDRSNIIWKYGGKVVISITRFDSVKQVEHIIRAFSYVQSKDKETKLLLVGEGKEKGYLQLLTKKYHIETSVIFVGHVHNISDYLRNSRLFVMSSRVEGFPNAIVEAMACGVPIVTTDTPGSCREILGKTKKNRNGIQFCEYGIITPYMSQRGPRNDLCLTKEEEVLGDAMMELIRSEEIYIHYAKKSHLRASDYKLSKVMRKWDAVIKIT